MLESAPQSNHAAPAFFGTLTIDLVVVGTNRRVPARGEVVKLVD